MNAPERAPELRITPTLDGFQVMPWYDEQRISVDWSLVAHAEGIDDIPAAIRSIQNEMIRRQSKAAE